MNSIIIYYSHILANESFDAEIAKPVPQVLDRTAHPSWASDRPLAQVARFRTGIKFARPKYLGWNLLKTGKHKIMLV